ncbi:MAG: glucose-6-phosphate isomerase [Marinobacter sp. T13-3]|nr:MAG: glucose-6-phosphate isomerase [Marinobacter sp. T13-3]
MRTQSSLPPTNSLAWKKLEQQAEALKHSHLSQLFAEQPERFKTLSLTFSPLLMDFSKQLVTSDVVGGLVSLAHEKQLPAWIERLFAGESVNDTEQRAAQHWALRLPAAAEGVDADLLQRVQNQREKMRGLVEQLRGYEWKGYSGKAITDVVNIGVGGSDLGPQMACEALNDAAVCANTQLRQGDIAPRVHFASSMEGSQLAQLLQELNPATTLFVIASKSFTTQDTMANVETVLAWFGSQELDETLMKRHHLVGISTRSDLMQAWGIAPEHQLQFGDWVGGRFSLWSTIGFSVAVKIGYEAFESLLAGAHAMDEHFRTAPLAQNLPVMNALLGVWNTNFLAINTHAVLPYDGRLKHLPAYLQQLEMESNGKSARRDGEPVSYRTCPIIWGEVGPNGQHAFYQLLHQGTERVSSDFVLVANRYREAHYAPIANSLQRQHRLGLANGLAQSQLLALGEQALPDATDLPAHKRYPGSQPSTTLMLDELNPYSLGMLLALYEHKVFVQSVIWEINPFDQWGVELGKKLAGQTLGLLQQGSQADLSGLDASTAGLLMHVCESQR